MHHIVKGYILAESNLDTFREAVKGQDQKIALLALGDSWLVPESVKWLNETCFEAVNTYTNGVLIEYENEYPVSANTKSFVTL